MIISSEGLITAVIGLLSLFIIPNWPETATFLNPTERSLLLTRLSTDVADAKMDRLDRPALKRIFSDWKIYISILMYLGVINTGYATSFFTPTIIHELGYTATAAQVRSIPVFVVATVCSLATALATDRLRHRFGFCIAGILIASIGYIVLLAQETVSVGGRYGAIFLIVSGGYITQPVTLAWIQNNVAGHYKRAITSAMVVGFGNCGGIVASNVFITSQAPRYPVGYGVSLAFLWMTAAACVVLAWGVRRENGKREMGERDWRLDLGEESDNLGDDHPRFRFTY